MATFVDNSLKDSGWHQDINKQPCDYLTTFPYCLKKHILSGCTKYSSLKIKYSLSYHCDISQEEMYSAICEPNIFYVWQNSGELKGALFEPGTREPMTLWFTDVSIYPVLILKNGVYYLFKPGMESNDHAVYDQWVAGGEILVADCISNLLTKCLTKEERKEWFGPYVKSIKELNRMLKEKFSMRVKTTVMEYLYN